MKITNSGTLEQINLVQQQWHKIQQEKAKEQFAAQKVTHKGEKAATHASAKTDVQPAKKTLVLQTVNVVIKAFEKSV